MINNNIHNISYWEFNEYFRQWDLIIVGGGIVGLSTGISFLENNPHKSALILERGILPSGASTKNAGFACFGTAGEILDDLSKMPADVVWQTVAMRYEGLKMLRKRLGDDKLGFEKHGGFEIFYDQQVYDTVCSKIAELNVQFEKWCGLQNCLAEHEPQTIQLPGAAGAIVNPHEGQIDTGKTMYHLQQLFYAKGGTIINSLNVTNLREEVGQVLLDTPLGVFRAARIVVAINGFARQLLEIEDVRPARAQVLITSPIQDLELRGTFHVDKGYIYFRNVGDRILLGGARNLDFETETTESSGLNQLIQEHLTTFLRTHILPDSPFTVEHRWTGIMGVGSEKQPIIRRVGKRVVAALRMGGMGIAIGSLVGKKAAELVES